MRNTWKGLIVGGLTGAGAGALLDLIATGSRQAAVVGERAREYAPVAAERVRGAVAAGADHLEDAHIPDRIADVAHRVHDSDLADEAREAVGKAVQKGKALAGSVDGSDLADQARGAVGKAVQKGKALAGSVDGSDLADQARGAMGKATSTGRSTASAVAGKARRT